MVKIRLKRVGKRKQPSYRVVVADSRSPRDGRNIESIGSYQPRREPSGIAIDNERALFWLQRGAQPSPPVQKLLRISGAWAMFTGEAPPQETPAARPQRRATPAASVGAASDDQPADLPEAADQAAAAPDADVDEAERRTSPDGDH
ncbi:MAG: 30S ribosomal protein S16 [Actinomycetota bacterium]